MSAIFGTLAVNKIKIAEQSNEKQNTQQQQQQHCPQKTISSIFGTICMENNNTNRNLKICPVIKFPMLAINNNHKQQQQPKNFGKKTIISNSKEDTSTKIYIQSGYSNNHTGNNPDTINFFFS